MFYSQSLMYPFMILVFYYFLYCYNIFYTNRSLHVFLTNYKINLETSIRYSIMIIHHPINSKFLFILACILISGIIIQNFNALHPTF